MAFEAIDEKLRSTSDDDAWELFHENSKTSRRERHSIFPLPPSDATIVRSMNRLRTVKPYLDYPKVALPTDHPPSEQSFDEVMRGRVTARAFDRHALISDRQLAKALFAAYGITRDQAETHYPRPFRTIPSGGALYPLEIYLHANRVDGLSAGLYHYNAEASNLDVLRLGNDSEKITGFLFQQELGANAAAILFISAVFFRSTFKYGDRGYRFVLLEAGHLAQNVMLTASGMGLAAAPIGGYLDRAVDRYLGFDGLTESVVYMILLGHPPALEATPEETR